MRVFGTSSWPTDIAGQTPRTNRVVARIPAKAQVVAAGEGDVWIGEAAGIAEIDTARNVVSRRVAMSEEGIVGLPSVPEPSGPPTRSAGASGGFPSSAPPASGGSLSRGG